MQNELLRKSVHFFIILIPILYCLFGKWPSLLVIIPIAIAIVALDFLRQKNPQFRQLFAKIFGRILRPHEISGEKLCGLSWTAIAACINFLIFRKEIAVTSFAILAISDGLAPLIGKAVPSKKSFFEKPYNSALAFFLSGLLVVVVCALIFKSGFWFYFFGIFALACSTIIEARPSLFKIDDNFTVPISFALIMTCFDLMWNYNY